MAVGVLHIQPCQCPNIYAVTSLLGAEECLHHPPAMEEGADEDILSLVASMCGGGGDLGQGRGEPLARDASVGRQVKPLQ